MSTSLDVVRCLPLMDTCTYPLHAQQHLLTSTGEMQFYRLALHLLHAGSQGRFVNGRSFNEWSYSKAHNMARKGQTCVPDALHSSRFGISVGFKMGIAASLNLSQLSHCSSDQ